MPSRIRYHRGPQRLATLLLAALFVTAWWLEEWFLAPPGWQRPAGHLITGDYQIQRVVDGDTIILEQDALRVRLQGVDTPETVKENTPIEAWGPEATEYTTRFLEDANWQVRLVVDGEPVDRYGRHLAFVWHAGRLLNEELVQQGLAYANTNFDFSRSLKNRLQHAQDQAKATHRGIWGTSQQTNVP